MSDQYPYPPPADAKEWTCPHCGSDLLWCGCVKPDPLPPASGPGETILSAELTKDQLYEKDCNEMTLDERIDHARFRCADGLGDPYMDISASPTFFDCNQVFSLAKEELKALRAALAAERAARIAVEHDREQSEFSLCARAEHAEASLAALRQEINLLIESLHDTQPRIERAEQERDALRTDALAVVTP